MFPAWFASPFGSDSFHRAISPRTREAGRRTPDHWTATSEDVYTRYREPAKDLPDERSLRIAVAKGRARREAPLGFFPIPRRSDVRNARAGITVPSVLLRLLPPVIREYPGFRPLIRMIRMGVEQLRQVDKAIMKSSSQPNRPRTHMARPSGHWLDVRTSVRRAPASHLQNLERGTSGQKSPSADLHNRIIGLENELARLYNELSALDDRTDA